MCRSLFRCQSLQLSYITRIEQLVELQERISPQRRLIPRAGNQGFPIAIAKDCLSILSIVAIENSAESSVPQRSLSKRTGDLPTTRTRTGLSDEVRAHSMSDSIPENSQVGDSFTREDQILSHGRKGDSSLLQAQPFELRVEGTSSGSFCSHSWSIPILPEKRTFTAYSLCVAVDKNYSGKITTDKRKGLTPNVNRNPILFEMKKSQRNSLEVKP